MEKSIDAIVFTAKNTVGFGRFTPPPCGPDEIVVQTAYTMVSPGTELRVLAGHYGSDGKYPLIPGYSVVGRIVEVGSDLKGWRTGDWVTGRNPKPIIGIASQWGGQASMHVYAAHTEDRPVLLPDGANPLDYTITELAAISLRGITAAAPRPGETAVVIGQGMIGAFSAAWLRLAGCRVCVVDMEPARLQRALKSGVSAAFSAADADIAERIMAFCNDGADMVVEASGTIPGVRLALQMARKKPQAYGTAYKKEPMHFYHEDWPRVVLQANYIDKMEANPFALTRGEAFTLISPQDRGVEDRQRTVEAIRRGDLRPADFLDLVTPWQNAPDGYKSLQDKSRFSVVFSWA